MLTVSCASLSLFNSSSWCCRLKSERYIIPKLQSWTVILPLKFGSITSVRRTPPPLRASSSEPCFTLFPHPLCRRGERESSCATPTRASTDNHETWEWLAVAVMVGARTKRTGCSGRRAKAEALDDERNEVLVSRGLKRRKNRSG